MCSKSSSTSCITTWSWYVASSKTPYCLRSSFACFCVRCSSHLKPFTPNQINSDNKDILRLLCQQGKHLERSCQFYLALKYYFAGLHYFGALARSQPALQLDYETQAISQSFQSLFDNLLPLSNQQVRVLPLFYLTGCASVSSSTSRICFVTLYRCTSKLEQLLNISEG